MNPVETDCANCGKSFVWTPDWHLPDVSCPHCGAAYNMELEEYQLEDGDEICAFSLERKRTAPL
jgi:endogenous inhibitor of DNA gyrase (YacG/DUF329 family)